MFAFDQGGSGERVNLAPIYSELHDLRDNITALSNLTTLTSISINTTTNYNFNSPITSLSKFNCLSGLNMCSGETLTGYSMVDRDFKEGVCSNSYRSIDCINLRGYYVNGNTLASGSAYGLSNKLNVDCFRFAANSVSSINVDLKGIYVSNNKFQGGGMLNINCPYVNQNSISLISTVCLNGGTINSNLFTTINRVNLSGIFVFSNKFGYISNLYADCLTFSENTVLTSSTRTCSLIELNRVTAFYGNSLVANTIRLSNFANDVVTASSSVSMTNSISATELEINKLSGRIWNNRFNCKTIRANDMDVDNWFTFDKMYVGAINGETSCFDFDNLHPFEDCYKVIDINGVRNSDIIYTGQIPDRVINFDCKCGENSKLVSYMTGRQRVKTQMPCFEVGSIYPNLKYYSICGYYGYEQSHNYDEFNNYYETRAISCTTAVFGMFNFLPQFNSWYIGGANKNYGASILCQHILNGNPSENINFRITELEDIAIINTNMAFNPFVTAADAWMFTDISGAVSKHSITIGDSSWAVNMNVSEGYGLRWYTSGTLTSTVVNCVMSCPRVTA